MTSTGWFTQADFRSDIAKQLGFSLEELAEFHDHEEAGLDSLRIMTLIGKWRKHGVTLTFVELAQLKSFQGWWELIETRLQLQSQTV